MESIKDRLTSGHEYDAFLSAQSIITRKLKANDSQTVINIIQLFLDSDHHLTASKLVEHVCKSRSMEIENMLPIIEKITSSRHSEGCRYILPCLCSLFDEAHDVQKAKVSYQISQCQYNEGNYPRCLYYSVHGMLHTARNEIFSQLQELLLQCLHVYKTRLTMDEFCFLLTKVVLFYCSNNRFDLGAQFYEAFSNVFSIEHKALKLAYFVVEVGNSTLEAKSRIFNGLRSVFYDVLNSDQEIESYFDIICN
ncbi:hypothetical protein P9112_000414 [Eukaryota sp. TZLM1-RC]